MKLPAQRSTQPILIIVGLVIFTVIITAVLISRIEANALISEELGNILSPPPMISYPCDLGDPSRPDVKVPTLTC